ncbi:MAG TPA: T9SS type A sorting domain-containing protein [Flavobacteriales bacterium]
MVFATEHFVEGTPFMWHFGDGVSMLGGAVISHVYESPGFYIVNCVYVNQVCNGYQLSEMITVEECEEACTASFEVQPNETPGQFTLVNTSSPMSQDVEWVWSLGNGQQSTDTDVDVTYTFSDEYEVCLVMYSDECVSAYCQEILVEGLQTECIPVDASITSYYTQGSGPEVIHWLLATDDGNALESGQLQFDYLPTYNINLCLMNNCYILSLEGSNVAGQFVDLSIEALNASAIQHIEAPNENLMRVCFGVQAACTIGTDEMSASSALVAYPNPAQDVLYITGNEKWQRLELVDMIGQLVWSTLPNAPITRLDVAHLAAGVYIIKAQTEHTSLTKRIVIEH